jgi:SAM-dependent MidA family methyltransferase
MLDPDHTSPISADASGGRYPIDEPPATSSLSALIKSQIERNGPLSFTDFMATALYEPTLGYYARGTRQVGRGGDFFTSVSVGPLFGELLARRFIKEWESLGSPGKWRIIECGAHDGTLAADVLRTLQKLAPQAFAAIEYCIPEPLPRLQSSQREALVEFSESLRFIRDCAELVAEELPGIAFGNELLDALPFHVVEYCGGDWWECRVATATSGELIWENHPVTDVLLRQALKQLGEDFPEGYRTEIRTNYQDFLTPLTRCLSSGLLLWLDYGFARPEYYHPGRSAGTLRTFSSHKAGEDPFDRPGEIDITAHVDFTAVAEMAILLGAQPAHFSSQGSWLTDQARGWLLAQEGSPDLPGLRQFQTLTHPAHLGGSFHALEIAWNRPKIQPSEIDLHRLALRACPSPESH